MAASSETWQASVLVRSLPLDVTDAEIKDAFGGVGTVVSITPASVTRRAFIVQLSSEAEADAAVEKLEDTKLREDQVRGLRLSKARAPVAREPVPNCVYVRNLPYGSKRASVVALLGDPSSVKKVVIGRRGSAHVYFEEEADVAAALTKSGTEVEGRTLYVEKSMQAVDKPKAGSRRAKKTGKSGAPAGAAAAGDAAAARAPRPSKKLRVNGLAEGTTDEDVKAFGEGAGEVVKVTIVDSAVSGLHAYIVYADAEAAAAAVDTLNGKALGGADVEVKVAPARRPRRNRRARGGSAGAADGEAGAGAAKAKSEPRPADPLRVWVGNLPAGVEQQEVVEAFKQFGDVARFQRRRADDQYCFITFATAEGAEAAKEAGTFAFNGAELTVEASRASPRRTGGRRKARPGRRAVPTADAAAEGAAE